MEAVDFVHKDGFRHGQINASNILLNVHPSYMHHRYCGYPDIQLVDFSSTSFLTDLNADAALEQDARDVAQVFERVIFKWSSEYLWKADLVRVGDGPSPMQRTVSEVQKLLNGEKAFGLKHLKRVLLATLEATRYLGPEEMPDVWLELLHADLASNEEMTRATRSPVVIKIKAGKEQLRRIVEGHPADMGSGGHARMRTSRIMVMRFTNRKAEFLGLVGKEYANEVEHAELRELNMAAEQSKAEADVPYVHIFDGFRDYLSSYWKK